MGNLGTHKELWKEALDLDIDEYIVKSEENGAYNVDKRKTMSLKEYQERSMRTINKELTKEQLISNMAMGIAGETGEVIDLIKKHLYQGHNLDKLKLKEEIGDVMFYIVNLCNIISADLEGIIDDNYNKLMKRYPDGFSEERSVNRE